MFVFLSQFSLFTTSSPDSTKKLYWATCDIRHCFDNIAPPRVFELCKKLLKETDYIVRKYSVLHAYDSEKRVVTNQREGGEGFLECWVGCMGGGGGQGYGFAESGRGLVSAGPRED